ncbi:hypothetical protein JXO52_05870 [bacterium]|nr:hypothetical protein [bacterium]
MAIRIRVPAIIALCVLNGFALGAHILVWDNDNNVPYYSTELQTYEYCYQPFERLLQQKGHQVTVSSRLPDDLSAYDAVFVILGFFCPG